MRLYFDGIEFYNKSLSNYGYDSRDVSTLKKHLWARLTLPIQALLMTVEVVVMQTLRGIGSLLSGLLTLEGRKIENGFQDLLSMLIQVLILPMLGIVSFFVPQIAKNWANSFHGKQVKDVALGCGAEMRKEITGIIRGILGFPIGIVDGVLFTASGILSGDFELVKEAIQHLALGIISPILGLISGCHTDSMDKIKTVHWMNSSSFISSGVLKIG